MKNIILLITLVLFASNLYARQGQMGVGLMIGNPTGISGKYWLDDNKAIDAGLGASFGNHTDFSIHSDYLLHKENQFYFNEVYALDLYYGIGGRMEFADEIELGARVPVGIVHEIKEKSADVFAEVAPVLDFIGREGVELNLALGTRYYF